MNETEELFSNAQLNVRHLPDADQLDFVMLEPAYKMVRYIGSGLISIIIILVSSFVLFTQVQSWPYAIYLFSSITIVALWMIIYSGLSYRYMGYALREKDISMKSGWLWRSMITVPFNRVQHCDIKQGLIDRQFGLSRLTIYTAGGQSIDLMIPGLLPDTAERLKTFILTATERSVDEG